MPTEILKPLYEKIEQDYNACMKIIQELSSPLKEIKEKDI